jgi:hypothetical protein
MDTWRSDRLWALANDGSWTKAGGEAPDPKQGTLIPKTDAESKKMEMFPCHIFQVGKRLVEANPKLQVGLVMFASGGGTGDNDYGGMLKALKPHIDGFGTVIVFNELQAKFAPKIVAEFQGKAQVHCINVPIRYDRFDSSSSIKATNDGGARYAKAEAEALKFHPAMEFVTTDDLRYKDNRHMHWQGGIEVLADRIAAKSLAKGWIPGVTADTAAPSVPAKVMAGKAWSRGAMLTWEASKDDRAVAGYDVLVDGTKVGFWPTAPGTLRLVTTTCTSFPVATLMPGKSHQVQVVAVDYADNRSQPSAAVAITTPTSDPALTVPVRINVGGPAAEGFLADKEWREGGGYGRVCAPGVLHEAPATSSGKNLILQSWRTIQASYRFDLPNGDYQVRWHVRATQFNKRFTDADSKDAKFEGFTRDDAAATALGAGVMTQVQTVTAKDGSITVLAPPVFGSWSNKGWGGMDILAVEVLPAP